MSDITFKMSSRHPKQHLYQPPPPQDYSSNFCKLIIVIVISLVFIAGEFVGGHISGSISVISDAFHLVTDLLGFIVSFVFIYLSRKKPNQIINFGYHRMELLGALGNLFIIWGLACFLIYQATLRIINKQFVQQPLAMLIVACGGLVINIIMYFVLHNGGSHSHGLMAESCSHSHKVVNQSEINCCTQQNFCEDVDCIKMMQFQQHCHIKKGDMQEIHKHQKKITNRKGSDDIDVEPKMMAQKIYKEHIHNQSCKKVKPQNLSKQQQQYLQKNKLTRPSANLKQNQKKNNQIQNNHEHQTHNHNGHKCQGHNHQGHNHQGHNHQGHNHQGHNHQGHKHQENKNQGHNHEGHNHQGHNHQGHNHQGHNHQEHNHEGHNHGEYQQHQSIGMKAAILHALSDVIQSIGLLIASFIIFFVGSNKGAHVTEWNDWHYLDPISTYVFSLIVVVSTFPIAKSCYYLIMEATPPNFQINDMKKSLQEFSGVLDVHDLHIWDLRPGKTILIAHIFAQKGTQRQVLIGLTEIARKKKIYHSTFQVEEVQYKNHHQYILCNHDIHD